ncbi:hypothetical protein K1X84_13480 [bacterium]|nr:hypothetical protein [bacterium]
MKFNSQTFTISEAGSFGQKALIVGGIGLAASAAGYFIDPKQFYFSYLTAFVFWASIGIGGLFFTLLHHLVGATWSIVLRRIAETTATSLPVMLILFIPVVLGMHDLYHWTHTEVVAGDAILQRKSGYLNIPFFLIRTVAYFTVWTVFGWMLYKMSLKQDNGDQSGNERMRTLSAPGMILFALSTTYAAYDWLMSLDPHWYSTIFGVYYFAGGLLGVLSFFAVFALYLRKKSVLAETITVEHYHDLGKLLFGFTIFWAYIGFSQFFLIWYANIPEETVYYLHRWEGSWKYVSLLLIFGHLMLPFLALIARAPKRNLNVLKVIGFWLLFMHWVDIHWMVLPTLHHHGVSLSWMDLTAMMGVGGIFLWFFWQRFSANALVPKGDPRLEASIHIVN